MNSIPDAAIYRGPPDQETIRVIGVLTRADSEGRLYYRNSAIEGWRRLSSRRDYYNLNEALIAIKNYRKGMTQ